MLFRYNANLPEKVVLPLPCKPAINITVGDPAQFIIADLNSGNTTITENVTNAPSDWTGNKYKLDGTTWSANPAWVDPSEDDGE